MVANGIERIIKVHELEISEGTHIVADNPYEFSGQQIHGTCGGTPFPSNDVYIFPVGDKDVVYVYHQRGQRKEDMSTVSYAEIIGYLVSGEIELNDGERVSFDQLNPASWQSKERGHSGRIKHLRIGCDGIPKEDYSLVREACPVSELPVEYREK